MYASLSVVSNTLTHRGASRGDIERGEVRKKTRDLSGLDTAPLEFVQVGQVGHTAGHCGVLKVSTVISLLFQL
jgi:hypothetical protein